MGMPEDLRLREVVQHVARAGDPSERRLRHRGGPVA